MDVDVTRDVVDENGVAEKMPEPSPTASPEVDVTTQTVDSDITPDSYEALKNLPPPQVNTGDSPADRFRAAAYAVSNGFSTGMLQQVPAKYVNARIKSFTDGIPYAEALQSLSDLEEKYRRQYEYQTPALETAGNVAGTALSSVIPGWGMIAKSFAGTGKLAMADMARKYGVISAEGAMSGYLSAPMKEGELQNPMQSGAIGAVAAPGLTAVGSGLLRSVAALANTKPAKSIAEWWIASKGTNEAERKAIKDALGRYSSSSYIDDKGNPVFPVDEIDEKAVSDITTDILNGFNRAAETAGGFEADIVRLNSELKDKAHNAALLKQVVKEKLSSIDIPEETVIRTRQTLDVLRDKIKAESDKAVDSLAGDKVTMHDLLRAFVSAENSLKGQKGYLVLGEKDAQKKLAGLFSDISARFKTKKGDKIVWKQDPKTIALEAAEVKEVIKTVDRTLDDWYEQSSGMFKGEIAGGVDLKRAFSTLRTELSEGLKKNEAYKAGMKRASELSEIRRNAFDVIGWNTSSNRPVYENLRSIGSSMMKDEQMKIREFGKMATGFDLEAEMLRFKAAKEALKNVDSMFDWQTGRLDVSNLVEATESLSRIGQIKEILPAEHDKAASILNEMIVREQLINQAADSLYNFVSANKKLFKKPGVQSLDRTQIAGGMPTAPKVLIGDMTGANAFVNRVTNPRQGKVTVEEENAIRALENAGLTDSKDILERLMDARAAKTLSKNFIRGSRGVVTGRELGAGVGAAVGNISGMKGAGSAGAMVGTALARVAEDWGPSISRRLFRLYLTKQMQWSRGISKIPGAAAIALSNAAIGELYIKKDDPEYQAIMGEVFNDKSIPADKKIQILNDNREGIRVEME